MTETTDFIPGDDQRSDLNKQLAALVKVQVVDEITDVEGNVVGDIVNHGVEKWIYLAQGSRNMKIHLKNNLPIRVVFRDYKINGLKSNRVYELVLKVTQTGNDNKTSEEKGNYLQLQVSPAKAIVSIWSEGAAPKSYRPEADGTIKMFLPYGRYYYKAGATGYNDTEGSVFVNDELRWETITLREMMGYVTITCPTPKADFHLDDQLIASNHPSNTWTGEVTPGKHTICISKKGYVQNTKDFTVKANETVTVAIERLMTLKEANAQKKKEAKARKRQEAEQQKQAKEQAKLTAEYEKQQPQQRPAKPAKPVTTTVEKPATFGILAGLNMATIGLDSDADGSCSMVTSFHLGANADIRLTTPLHLNISLLYSQKGYSYESDYTSYRDEDATAQFISLPVQLSYRIKGFQINVGPYIDLGIGGQIKTSKADYDTFDYFDSFNYGVTVGVGYTFAEHFTVGANYEMGFSDYANRNIRISIGYNF